mgnify:FL=1
MIRRYIHCSLALLGFLAILPFTLYWIVRELLGRKEPT